MEGQSGTVSNATFMYLKRYGTSGIGGQLYESKLLSLFLLRTLNHIHVTKFYLGTNIEGIGAFDDVALQYETNSEVRPKIVFLQAKHKDDPEQNKITFQDLSSEHGDFCLHKYFDSYVKIKNKFGSDNNDGIFKYAFKDVDCNFIIYTPAMENIGNKKLLITGNISNHSLFHTSLSGKIFRLKYVDDDVQRILQTALEVRAQLLGRTFIKFLLKDNYQNLLMDDLMKIYHVFLTQYVVEVAPKETPVDPYLKAKFRSSFIESKDKYLKILKQAIYKEFSIKFCSHSPDKRDEMIRAYVFKLPLGFGNLYFNIAGNSKKVQKRLVYINSKIKQLINIAESSGPYLVVKIDESVVGPGMILQDTDLEIYRLGGLVGNMFIFDNDTSNFKFNESIESLPPHVKNLYDLLINEYPEETDFNNYRFDFNICRFPKLSLGPTEYELTLLKEFLDKLIFYTNQACEEDVEKVLKSEIIKCCKLSSNSESLRNMKCESIFLKVHDTIQKWWKQPNKAPYLDENCKYYHDAKEQLINSSMLSTLHSLYTTKLKSYGVQFREFEEQFSVLNESNLHGVLNIVTSNVTFTSIKLIQYLNGKNEKFPACIFLNLDFIISENCFHEVILELKEMNVKTVFVTCENNNLYYHIIYILYSVQGLVVVITKGELRASLLNLNLFQYVQIKDKENTFIDLTLESQRKIMKEAKVNFQGYTIHIKQFKNDNFKLLDSEVLFAILNKQVIQIGLIFTSFKPQDFEDFYVQRTMNQCTRIRNKQICDKYADRQIFKRNTIDRPDRCQHHSYCPKTLLDIEEKVIILSAPPGMGKSTFMTYLSIETKKTDPNYWILKINCLDHKDSFNRWHENNTAIDLTVVIKFLYKVACQLDSTCDDLIVNIGPDGHVFIDPNNRKFGSLRCLEIDLFNNLYINEQIVVVFDGVDEISPDYFNTVMSVLEVLRISKVKRLWITTRPYNIVKTLEQKLGTLVFIFDKLCSDDQEDLFQALIMKKFCNRENRNLDVLLYDLIDDDEFASAPLNIFMLAEVFDELCKAQTRLDKYNLNILRIYETFVEIKFSKIMLEEKRPYFSKTDPELKEMMKMYRKIFIKIHKRLAAHVLFNKNIRGLFSAHDKEEISNALARVKRGEVRAGIINSVFDDEAQFVHLTFAEYFATEYLCDKLKSNECSVDIWRYLIDTILVTDKFSRVRQFFDLKLSSNNELYRLADGLKYKQDIFCALIKQPVRNSLYYVIAGNVSAQEIALFLLQCMKSVLSRSNMGAFLRYIVNFTGEFVTYEEKNVIWLESSLLKGCVKRWRAYKSILNTVLKFVKAVDHSIFPKFFECKKYSLLIKTYCFAIAVEDFDKITLLDRHWLDMMLTSVENDILLDCFTMSHDFVPYKTSIPQLLAMNPKKTRFFLKYLVKLDQEQRFKLFSTTDADGQLAAHVAISKDNLELFAVMACLLNENDFIKICFTCDDEGETPIACFLETLDFTLRKIVNSLNLLDRSLVDRFYKIIKFCLRFKASYIFVNIGLKLLFFLFYSYCLSVSIRIRDYT